jgi:DNA-binding CsgD family transcriptional regulator
MRLGLSGDGHLAREARARVGDRLAWARVVRARDVGNALEALADPATFGVVITGDPSLAKSAVGSVVLNDLEATHHTVRLRSTIVGTETPYGALAVLLARLPEDAQEDPVSIMRGIIALLTAAAGGRPTVLLLETSNNLDELSTATLVNIMVTGTAKLVVVADRASDLPADFHWMLAEERLREVPLSTLSADAMHAGLRELLGGIVPQTVSLQLEALSRGNPQVAFLTVAELLARGDLEAVDGVWVLAPDADTTGMRQLDDLVRARIERLPAGIKSAIEAIACARRIPLARLTTAFGHEDIARMEREGLIAVEETGRHSVTLTDPLMGEVVRGWLSVPRRRELRALLLADGLPPLEVLTHFELLGLAAWTHECHAQLPTGHAIAAAKESLRLWDAKFALECLDWVERDDALWPEVQRLRAGALLMLQLPHQALACMDQVSDAELEAQSRLDVAAFASVKATAMRSVPGRADDVPAYLDAVRARLLAKAGGPDAAGAGRDPGAGREGGAGRDADGTDCIVAARLDLAEFEYWAFCGDFARIVDRLEAAVAESQPAEEEARLVMASILMEARTVLGRERDGLALLHELTSEISLTSASIRVRQAFATRAFDVLLYNGHWRQALAVLRATPDASSHYLRSSGASVELATGLALVMAGRGQEAMGSLQAAIALLERSPAARWLGLAYAAAAFACAQRGDAAATRSWLAKLDSSEPAEAYRTRFYTQFCSDMARRWIGDAHAAARLVASAREDIAHGRWNPAGIKLVGATVDARADELRLLEEVCRHRQGQLAEIGGLLARGTRTGSLTDLAAAADLAAGLELDAVESRCAAVALDKARSRGNTVMAHLMQARLDALEGRVAVLPVTPSQATPTLTQREQEVAVLAAAGTSNRRIAEDLGLSVRTVEGHLYQVFAKLSVSNRGELAGLVVGGGRGGRP